MSGKMIAALVVGCALGAVGGYITAKGMAQSEVGEARAYQAKFAQENSALTTKNLALERRMALLNGSTYDRQAIRACVFDATVLSSAVENYRLGKPLGSIERGMLDQYMGSAMVAVQGKSMQAAMYTLLDEKNKVSEECLDRARITAQPAALAGP